MKKLELLTKIYQERKAREVKFNGHNVILYPAIAEMILSVFYKLNKEEKKKFLKLRWNKMVTFAHLRLSRSKKAICI